MMLTKIEEVRWKGWRGDADGGGGVRWRREYDGEDTADFVNIAMLVKKGK